MGRHVSPQQYPNHRQQVYGSFRTGSWLFPATLNLFWSQGCWSSWGKHHVQLTIISNDCFPILSDCFVFQRTFALLLLVLLCKPIKILPVWVGCCSPINPIYGDLMSITGTLLDKAHFSGKWEVCRILIQPRINWATGSTLFRGKPRLLQSYRCHLKLELPSPSKKQSRTMIVQRAAAN